MQAAAERQKIEMQKMRQKKLEEERIVKLRELKQKQKAKAEAEALLPKAKRPVPDETFAVHGDVRNSIDMARVLEVKPKLPPHASADFEVKGSAVHMPMASQPAQMQFKVVSYGKKKIEKQDSYSESGAQKQTSINIGVSNE